MPEVIRYYTDENVGKAIAKGLALRGIDVLTCQEAGMMGATDEEHLRFATFNNRVVFSQDADFLRLHNGGVEHAGIVYAHQGKSIGEIVNGLTLIYQVLSREDMRNHVEFL